MNKYIVRTSAVWLIAIGSFAGFYLYRNQKSKPQRATSGEVQPVAVGSAASETKANNPPVNAAASEGPLVPVQLTPERMQSIGVQTGTVQRKQITDVIRATGTVDIDERLISYVQVRFSGYLRKVFANATYQYINKGEPLFTIYSPELLATQNEYLLAKRNELALSQSSVDGVALAAAALTAAAEARLKQWDISQSDLAALQETGKPMPDLVVNSPVSGYITE